MKDIFLSNRLLVVCIGLVASAVLSSFQAIAKTEVSIDLRNSNMVISKAGMPLPAPNKDLAKNWPPEARRVFDGLLELFYEKRPSQFSNQQLEEKIGIKLTLRPGPIYEIGVESIYDIAGSVILPSERAQFAWLKKMKPRANGSQTVLIELPIDKVKNCVSPYEFAIYTGQEFRPKPRPHETAANNARFAYEWGMFDRHPQNHYVGKRVGAIWTDGNCIGGIALGASYKLEISK